MTSRHPALSDPASDAPPQPPAPEHAAEVEAPEAAAEAEWEKALPEEIVAWLVRAFSSRDLWDWLGHEDRLGLRLGLLSGFRATPANIKQPAVSKRLVKHALQHPDILRQLVEKWREAHGPLFEAISERDDATLIEDLQALARAHGSEALLLALASTGRAAALDALASLADAGEDEAPASTSGAPDEAASTSEAPASTSDATASTSNASEAPNAATLEAAAGALDEMKRMRAMLEEARAREEKLRVGAQAATAHIEKERDKVLLKAREADRVLKAQAHKLAALEGEKSEAKRLLDRTERRLRHVEKQVGELESDNKRLRRQVRRQQEISEEVRKQLARANSELESLRPAPAASTSAAPVASTSGKPDAPKRPATPLSPLDREYVLSADGRKIHVTPREVQRRVDANDEEWVFRLIQSLEAVAQVDREGRKTFLEALKPLGHYYARVLTMDTTRVLVDASNVARIETDAKRRGRLRFLLEMRDQLRDRNCFPIKMVADASLPYFIDERAELEAMAKSGEIEMSLPGQEADEILAREARRTGAYVVTNDRLFFHKATPDFEPPRITFRVIAGTLIVDEF